MRETWTIAKHEVKRILLYALASAIMTIGLAFGVGSVVRSQAAIEASKTRDLVCAILVNSDNPDIVRAVKLYCESE